MRSAPRDAAAYLRLILAYAIMGTVGLARRLIPVSSALLAVSRGAIGAAILGAFVLLRGRARLRRILPKKLALLFLTGALIGLNWILLFEAYRFTSVAVATLCYYIQPTLVVLVSPLLLRERLTARRLVCAAAALAGMALVSGVFSPGGVSGANGKGALLGFAAGAVYAAVVLLNKKLDGVDAYEKTAVQLFAAAAACLPYLPATEPAGGLSGLTAGAVLALFTVGAVHTGLAYFLYFGSMERLPAQTVSMLSYLDPVVALLASALALREPLSPQGAVGAALILVSAVVSETGPRKRKIPAASGGTNTERGETS